MEKWKIKRFKFLLSYTFQVRKTGDGYWANVKELDVCHTLADSIEEALWDLEKILQDHIEIKLEFGEPLLESVDQAYSGKFNARVPKTLHKQLTLEAAAEAVSLNQYVVYRLSR